MARALVRVLVAVLLLGPGASAFADDEPAQSPVARVKEAIAAGDTAGLRKLAALDKPDPWKIVEALCREGSFEQARAFARAAPRKDTEMLAPYAAGYEKNPPGKAAHEANLKAAGLKDHAAALRAVMAVKEPGRSVDAVLLWRNRGALLGTLGRHRESAEASRTGAKLALRLGWYSRAGDCYQGAGKAFQDARDAASARACFEKRMEIATLRGSHRGQAIAHDSLANLLRMAGKPDQALTEYVKGRRAAEASGDKTQIARMNWQAGLTQRVLHKNAEALVSFRSAAALYEALGRLDYAANAHDSVGIVLSRQSQEDAALEAYGRALALVDRTGDERLRARVLANRSVTYSHVGDVERARADLEESLRLARSLSDEDVEAQTLGNYAWLDKLRGDYAEAERKVKRSLAIYGKLGRERKLPLSLNMLGLVQKEAGRIADALSSFERAVAGARRARNPNAEAAALNNLAGTYSAMRDTKRAVATYEQALRLQRALRDERSIAVTLGNLGDDHKDLGDLDRALALYDEAAAIFERLGDDRRMAQILMKRGMAQREGASPEETRATYARALALAEQGENPVEMVSALHGLAQVEIDRGQSDVAGPLLARAETLIKELGAPVWEMRAHWLRACMEFNLGSPRKSLASTRKAIAKFPYLVGGLGDEEGARARERWAEVYEHGIWVALRVRDMAEAFFFIESSRAATLLEGLGGKEALDDVEVPTEFADAEREARAAVAAAQARVNSMTQGGADRAARRPAYAALRKTQTALADVVARIQRASKSKASLSYGSTAKLKAVQSLLTPADALVLFVLDKKTNGALVVTRGGARFVALGAAASLDEAVDQLDLEDPGASSDEALKDLRGLLIDPLKIGKKTKRLLISPAGRLAYVPFTLFAPGRTVAFVPSGSTYALLKGQVGKRGKGVLALGDPDYTVAGPSGLRDLSPLPATRTETKVVGDKELLGTAATEAGLADALRKRKRWRAVHFACHGLVDAMRPQFSALALTATPESDGQLTGLEIMRMDVPTDLAVLSACETARGRIYAAEGIVGLTRAFMMAGSPRVLCSLWKVDDEATRAFMIAFYKLWKRGKVDAASALRQAQEHVRSKNKWKHPYYWAAWVLWGLP